MTQLTEVQKKIRVASELEGRGSPKGGVGPRRALPAGRGRNGPPRIRVEQIFRTSKGDMKKCEERWRRSA